MIRVILVALMGLAMLGSAQAQIFKGNESGTVRFLIKPFGNTSEVPPEVTDGKNIYVPGRVVTNGCREWRGWVDDTKKVCICLQELTQSLWVETDCNGQFDPPPGGTEVLGLGGGGGAGNQSLQSAASFGRTIHDASNAATAIAMGTATDHWLFYFDSSAGVLTQRGVCAGTDCNNTDTGIPPSGTYRVLDSSSQTVLEINDSGILSHEFERPIGYPAAAWNVDGTNCTAPAEVTVGGEKSFYVKCLQKLVTGKINFKEVLDGSVKTGSTIRVILVGRTTSATPSGSFDMEAFAKCEDADGGSNIAFGSTSALLTLDFAGASTDDWARAEAVLTPEGTCDVDSILSVQLTMATGSGQNDATLADILLFSQLYAFQASRLTSN